METVNRVVVSGLVFGPVEFTEPDRGPCLLYTSEDLDPAETELDESELAAVSGGSVIVSPLFKCNYQQDNTLCCASCAYSRFSYPNLYCFLDKNEGGPKPAEVMPLQSNGNLQ